MPLKQYRLYLDESGTEDYACVDEQGGRHLSLVGVIMEQEQAFPATANLNLIREHFFRRHPDEPPVIFHRSDIQRGRKGFQPLQDNDTRAEFNRWWLRYLETTPYKVICVAIDKSAMQKKENWRLKHPYHYAMSVLVEKYALFLVRHEGHGDLMPEARGSRQDNALQAAFSQVRGAGTYYVGADVVQERIPSKSLKFRRKADNITGLQIADSLTKAAQDYVLLRRKVIESVSPFAASIHDILVGQKFDRSNWGDIWGYGIKFLP